MTVTISEGVVFVQLTPLGLVFGLFSVATLGYLAGKVGEVLAKR